MTEPREMSEEERTEYFKQLFIKSWHNREEAQEDLYHAANNWRFTSRVPMVTAPGYSNEFILMITLLLIGLVTSAFICGRAYLKEKNDEERGSIATYLSRLRRRAGRAHAQRSQRSPRAQMSPHVSPHITVNMTYDEADTTLQDDLRRRGMMDPSDLGLDYLVQHHQTSYGDSISRQSSYSADYPVVSTDQRDYTGQHRGHNTVISDQSEMVSDLPPAYEDIADQSQSPVMRDPSLPSYSESIPHQYCTKLN